MFLTTIVEDGPRAPVPHRPLLWLNHCGWCGDCAIDWLRWPPKVHERSPHERGSGAWCKVRNFAHFGLCSAGTRDSPEEYIFWMCHASWSLLATTRQWMADPTNMMTKVVGRTVLPFPVVIIRDMSSQQSRTPWQSRRCCYSVMRSWLFGAWNKNCASVESSN